jgi:large subunit ribosomal protein L10
VKSKKQKQEEVEHLKKELADAENVVVVQYKGLSVAQDTELRNKVRKAESRYRVIKNRLANLAVEGTPAQQLASSFHGPTAIAYNSGDPVALAKALSAYAKENPAFEFRAGMVEGRVVEISKLAEIASMPSYDELIAQVLYLVNAPAQRIAVGVNAVVRNLAVALGQAVEQGGFGTQS